MNKRDKPILATAASIQAAIPEAIARNVDLSIDCRYGFEGSNFELVCADPRLRFLIVNSAGLADLSSLGNLTSLESLILRGKPGRCDLSRLANLKSLTIEWTPLVALPPRKSNLSILALDGYRPHSGTLEELIVPQAVEQLSLAHAAINSLVGIHTVMMLKRLMLFKCAKGLDIAAIDGCRRLEALEVYDSKGIAHWEALGRCGHLRELVLVGCGEIPTLGFLRGNAALRRVHKQRTWITDGDDEFLAGLTGEV